MFRKMLCYLKVSRFPLLLMGFLGPLACLKWINGFGNFEKSFFLILAIFSGNWAWNLYNEYHDQEVDKINKPWKPLPSGCVNEKMVITGFWILFYISVFAIFVLILFFGVFYVIGFLAHATSFIYNGLRRDLIGNICEVVTIGLAPFIVMYPENLGFPIGLALLFFGIALITQHQDLKGEKSLGVITAPQQLGRRNTSIVAFMSLFASIIIYNLQKNLIFIPFCCSALLNMFCSVVVLFARKNENRIIEIFSRKLGRLFILVGFISMLIFF